MKPVLHINAGVGWSATKPLCYTFEKEGYVQWRPVTEYNMLYYICERKYVPDHAKYYWKNHHSPRIDISIRTNKKYKSDFIKEDTTLDFYIQYMKSRVQDGYRGISDFSNSNGDLPEYFLKEIAPSLEEHFDVRITMIFRNPIRRSYSQISNWYKNFTDQELAPESWNANDENVINQWKKIKEKYPDSISYWKHQLIKREPWYLRSYVEIYKIYKNAFTKVFPIVMEEVWEDPSELSDFIEHPITSMWENVYYPERGTKGPRIKGGYHQWGSDMQDLSEDDLKYGREKLDWLYKEFKTQFGYIPPSWQESYQKS